MRIANVQHHQRLCGFDDDQSIEVLSRKHLTQFMTPSVACRNTTKSSVVKWKYSLNRREWRKVCDAGLCLIIGLTSRFPALQLFTWKRSGATATPSSWFTRCLNLGAAHTASSTSSGRKYIASLLMSRSNSVIVPYTRSSRYRNANVQLDDAMS